MWIDSPPAPDSGPGFGSAATAPEPAPPADARVAQPLPDGPPAAPAAGAWTCAQLDECCISCPAAEAESCCQGCFDAGAPAAQRSFNAMFACFDDGFDGVCQSSCADPGSDFCWDCLESACAAEVNACYLPQA